MRFWWYLEPPQPIGDCPRRYGMFEHPDPTACNIMLSCIDGEQSYFTCPGDLIFDEESSECTWPEEAQREGCRSQVESKQCHLWNWNSVWLTVSLNGYSRLGRWFPMPQRRAVQRGWYRCRPSYLSSFGLPEVLRLRWQNCPSSAGLQSRWDFQSRQRNLWRLRKRWSLVIDQQHLKTFYLLETNPVILFYFSLQR